MKIILIKKYFPWKTTLLLVGSLIIQEISVFFTGQVSSKFYAILLNKSGFTSTALQSIALVILTASMTSLSSFLSNRIALELRFNISCDKMNAHVLNPNPISNADQRITEDLKQFANIALRLLQSVLLSPFLIIYYSLQLPFLHVFFIVIYFLISLITVGPWIKKCKSLTIDIDKKEGNYRVDHVDILNHMDQIRLSQSQQYHSFQLISLFSDIFHNTKRLIKLQFVLQFLQQFWAYLGSILSFLLVAIPIFTGVYNSLTEAELAELISKYSFLSMYLIYRFTMLIGLSDELSKLIAFSHRILEWVDSLEETKKADNLVNAKVSQIHEVRRDIKLEIQPSRWTNRQDFLDSRMDIVVDNLSFELHEIKVESINMYAAYDPAFPPLIKVLGPSGSGKSTLFKVLCGLFPKKSGTINIPQNSVFLPQSPYILRNSSLLKQIAYPNTNLSLAEMKVLSEYIEIFMLTHLLSRGLSSTEDEFSLTLFESPFDKVILDPSNLSPGEIQRLVFIRMLIKKPLWAFLDEPFSSLDSCWRDMMLSLCKQNGIAVVLIEH